MSSTPNNTDDRRRVMGDSSFITPVGEVREVLRKAQASLCLGGEEAEKLAKATVQDLYARTWRIMIEGAAGAKRPEVVLQTSWPNTDLVLTNTDRQREQRDRINCQAVAMAMFEREGYSAKPACVSANCDDYCDCCAIRVGWDEPKPN